MGSLGLAGGGGPQQNPAWGWSQEYWCSWHWPRRKRGGRAPEAGRNGVILGCFGMVRGHIFPFLSPQKSRQRLPFWEPCEAAPRTKPTRSRVSWLGLGAKFSSPVTVSARARLRLLPGGGQPLPGHPKAPSRPALPCSCDGGSRGSLRPQTILILGTVSPVPGEAAPKASPAPIVTCMGVLGYTGLYLQGFIGWGGGLAPKKSPFSS